MRASVIAAVSLGVATSLVGGAAAAQPSTSPAAAKILFDDAQEAMDRGDFAAACPKLEESVRLEPRAIGAKLALAQCYESAGKLASAWAAYAQVEAAAEREQQRDRERIAEERIAAIRPRLATLTVHVRAPVQEIAGLSVQRDGFEVGPGQWGSAVPADAGVHEVIATAPGRKPWARTVRVPRDGDAVEVRIDALEIDPAALSPDRPSQASSGPPAMGWVFIALAGVSAAAGATLLVVSQVEESESQSQLDRVEGEIGVECAGRPDPLPDDEACRQSWAAYDRAVVDSWVGGVGLGVAGVCAGIGAYLLLATPSGNGGPRPTARLEIGPGKIGVSAGLSF